MTRAMARYLVATLLCLAPAAQASDAWSPFHRSLGGSSVRVAYVHLQMEQTPRHREAGRRRIETRHEICRQGKEAARLVGEAPGPYRALPPEGVPQRPWVEDIEIYYGEGRSVTVVTSTTYWVHSGGPTARYPDRKDDCALARTTSRTIYYVDGATECKLRQREGRPDLKMSCKQVPGRAKANVAAPGIVVVVPIPQTPRGAGGQPAALPDAALPMLEGTGESRTIAGRPCRVFGTPDLTETCVATQADPAMLQVSPFHSVSGLLLQAVMIDRSYTARQVEDGIEVGDDLFRILDGNGVSAERLPPLPAGHR